MKTYLFIVYTEYLSEIDEAAQAANVDEAYAIIKAMYPNAIKITYNGKY